MWMGPKTDTTPDYSRTNSAWDGKHSFVSHAFPRAHAHRSHVMPAGQRTELRGSDSRGVWLHPCELIYGFLGGVCMSHVSGTCRIAKSREGSLPLG